MDYVVDVQGFKSFLNTFIFKEVVILAVEEDAIPLVYYFKPPYSWTNLFEEQKSVNRWLELHYVGIPWGSGRIPYKRHAGIIEHNLKDARRIYVKGLEKKSALREILPDIKITNLDDLDCPALKNLPKDAHTLCTQHTLCWEPVCAVQNAYALKTWLLLLKRKKHRFNADDDESQDHACGVDELDYPIQMAVEYKKHFDREILHSMYN